MTPELAEKLVSEFYNNEDLDGNGLIYGYDFKITDDSKKPAVLNILEKSPYWINPTTEKTWDDFTSSIT